MSVSLTVSDTYLKVQADTREDAMKTLLPDIPLTEPDKAMANRRRHTRPGMASWGGEEPTGRRCFECRHWLSTGHKASTGVLHNAECRKYTAMMNGKRGPRVPPDTLACRFFEVAEKPRSFYAGEQSSGGW
jgi:hypothetical protein